MHICFSSKLQTQTAEDMREQEVTLIQDSPNEVTITHTHAHIQTLTPDQQYWLDNSCLNFKFVFEHVSQMGNHIMKVVQRIVSQARGSSGIGSRQIIVRNTAVDEEGASISDCGDTITIATPESLTEQVAMTLASAIDNGTLLSTTGALDSSVGTVTMVTSEEAAQGEIQLVQQQEEYLITSPEEVEIQTVIV